MAETGFKDRIAPFLNKLPAVKRPEKHVHFKKKLMWTLGILVLYFILTNITVFGLSDASKDLMGAYRAIFAGASGSLVLLGIGPIVMASIVLQLLVGAEILRLDMSETKDQAIFQGLQKLLVFVMIIVEALPQIYGGFLIPDAAIATHLGINTGILQLIIFAQIFIGGVLILYMDEIVSKWGIGSGVSLFIIAGIAQALISGIINWNPPYPSAEIGYSVAIPSLGNQLQSNLPVGFIFKWYYFLTSPDWGIGSLLTSSGILIALRDGEILALISTVIIFLMVVYSEATRIEIPLAHSSVRGARGKFPVKLIYASVLPMILVRSLQATVQMFGLLIYNNFKYSDNSLVQTALGILGTFPEGSSVPQSGLMFYINPINGMNYWVPAFASSLFPGVEPWQLALHVLTDAFILIAGGILFAIFWVETTGMGASRVARQIQKSGMQIPGFRRNEQVIEKVVSRYIPKVTVIGGAFVGLLTLIASLFGVIGMVSGTGLLLAVSITYQLYEKLASEQIMEMHPLMRKFLGEE